MHLMLSLSNLLLVKVIFFTVLYFFNNLALFPQSLSKVRSLCNLYVKRILFSNTEQLLLIRTEKLEIILRYYKSCLFLIFENILVCFYVWFILILVFMLDSLTYQYGFKHVRNFLYFKVVQGNISIVLLPRCFISYVLNRTGIFLLKKGTVVGKWISSKENY